MISSLKPRLGKEIHVDSPVGKSGYIEAFITHDLKLQTFIFDIKQLHSAASALIAGDLMNVSNLLHASCIFV